MQVIELVVYGTFSGLLGGGLASAATFYLINRQAKVIQANIRKEAKAMSEKFKAIGLDNLSSELMQNEGSNQNWQ